jgi:hypothetical protein
LLDNDTDIDGDTLQITQLSNITGGTALLDGAGNVVITRTSASDESVSFDYSISDGNGGTSQASFSISLPGQAASNQAPLILSSTLSPVIEDHSSTGRVSASDSDGDALIFALKDGAGPSMGSVYISGDGSFTYTPIANANGPDQFTITVADGFNTPVETQYAFTPPLSTISRSPTPTAVSW